MPTKKIKTIKIYTVGEAAELLGVDKWVLSGFCIFMNRKKKHGPLYFTDREIRLIDRLRNVFYVRT